MGKKFLIVCSILLLMAASANATSIGYEFTITGSGDDPDPYMLNYNVPAIELKNLPGSAADITGFQLTIGDTDYNWDYVTGITGAGISSMQQVTPGNNSDDGVGSDEIHFTFTGFDPGEQFSFEADIDHDTNAGLNEQFFQYVLGNNDLSDGTIIPNALITVTFSGGYELKHYLPNSDQATVNFTQQDDIGGSPGAIPEPATLALFGFGLLSLAGVSRRKIL